jgi:hypothetical protein
MIPFWIVVSWILVGYATYHWMLFTERKTCKAIDIKTMYQMIALGYISLGIVLIVKVSDWMETVGTKEIKNPYYKGKDNE